jgi:uncharacterized phosphosugar-binding protein
VTTQRTIQAATPTKRFTADVTALIEWIAHVNAAAITRAAEAILATLRGDGLVHVGGAGHGLMLAFEAFYRAGGLACVSPVWRPALLPLTGARASTQAERTSGLGTTLAAEAGIASGDCLVLASQSGLNPVSIDLAAAARTRGATIIAVTSVAHGLSAPSRDPAGRRLPDVADIVIDTGVPPGDAAWRPGAPGAADRAGTKGRRVAALSTIASCHAWNLVLVTLAELAPARDLELPVWVSSNVPGGDEGNEQLLARYTDRVAAL